MKKNKGLYIHVPYCDELCPYCSFCHVYKNYGREEEYINKLISEIDLINEDIYSIYVGGGTPSSLDDDNFENLLKSLSDIFIMNFTVILLTKELILNIPFPIGSN